MPRSDELPDLLLAHAADISQADPHGSVLLELTFGLAVVDVRRADLDPTPLRFVHERVRRIEAHRLLVEQRTQELGAVVHAQPGRLIGEQPEGGAVGLWKSEPGESL